MGTVCKQPLKFYVFFGFVDKLAVLAGKQHSLQVTDLPPRHSAVNNVAFVSDRFCSFFSRSRLSNRELKVLLAAMEGRWLVLLLSGVGNMLGRAAALLGPVLLGQIIAALTARQAHMAASGDALLLCVTQMMFLWTRSGCVCVSSMHRCHMHACTPRARGSCTTLSCTAAVLADLSSHLEIACMQVCGGTLRLASAEKRL